MAYGLGDMKHFYKVETKIRNKTCHLIERPVKSFSDMFDGKAA